MFEWVKSTLDAVFGARPKPAAIQASDVNPYVRSAYWSGEKFAGGVGPIDIPWTDYWALRMRSAELFKKNLYARGLIKRMVDNEVANGLHLEATPEERVLGLAPDSLSEWSEDVENRFKLWANDPWLCDQAERQTFGALQAAARMEALISGDVLVILLQHRTTGLPRVQLVSGASVQTPFGKIALRAGNRIEHGVELDSSDRQVAYWILQRDRTSKRIPAWGEKSGRRLAWLVYGTEKRLDDVRGEPILSLVLQSLKEIDRYRDAIQRKAVLLAMLAMFVKKGEDKPGSMPLTGGAIRKSVEPVQDGAGQVRSFKSAEMIPGLVIDELQHGEEPHAFQSNGTYEKFGDFEEAIIQGVAWGLGIPPEILRLSFSNNYSASQAAINEYKLVLNKLRTLWGDEFCTPIYQEWLIAATLAGKVKASQLIESWRDSRMYDVFAAWTASDWSGAIKVAVDVSRLVAGYVDQINAGLMTRARATRELSGMKYSKVIQQLRLENEMLVAANTPLLALEPRVAIAAATPEPPAISARLARRARDDAEFDRLEHEYDA